jgi:outer membrane protein TolC
MRSCQAAAIRYNRQLLLQLTNIDPNHPLATEGKALAASLLPAPLNTNSNTNTNTTNNGSGITSSSTTTTSTSSSSSSTTITSSTVTSAAVARAAANKRKAEEWLEKAEQDIRDIGDT